MGKKSDGPSIHSRMNLGGYDRELERYGVEGPRFGRSDAGQEYRSAKDVEKDLIEAARNDYDTRRTLEAAAMSGKKKASKILKSGFKSIDDITNASNFMEKAAKRHGQGGDFSSASDYMGLTQSMVERDRRKFEESLLDRMDDVEDKTEEPSSPYDNPPGQRGGRELNTSAVYDDYQDAYKLAGISDGYYSTGGEGQAATESSTGDDITFRSKGASEQLAEFQQKVKTGMALAGVQTRGPQSGIVPGDGF